MNDFALVFLTILCGGHLIRSIYYFASRGHPKRTRQILNLEKVDYDYKHNVISAFAGGYNIGIAAVYFLMYLAVTRNPFAGIAVFTLGIVYIITCAKFIRKYVKDNRRYKL